MRLDEVLSLPQSGVVILVKGTQVLVSYTTSMGPHLEGMYNQFRGQSNIEMVVRSAGTDLETLKLHTEYYRNYYVRNGFTLLLTNYRKSIQYRVRVVPSSEFKGVDVEVVSARGDSKVVGKFKNIRDAKDFIETYYGTDNSFKFPVYAVNSATKEFLLDKQKKLLDIK